jgi:hypothetical protein
MPHRPKREIRRPSWNLEPDYHQREAQRLALVADIKSQALRFSEIGIECPSCDFPIWEALLPDGELWRGCHCLTLLWPPDLQAQPFSLKAWLEFVDRGNAVLTRKFNRN